MQNSTKRHNLFIFLQNEPKKYLVDLHLSPEQYAKNMSILAQTVFPDFWNQILCIFFLKRDIILQVHGRLKRKKNMGLLIFYGLSI